MRKPAFNLESRVLNVRIEPITRNSELGTRNTEHATILRAAVLIKFWCPFAKAERQRIILAFKWVLINFKLRTLYFGLRTLILGLRTLNLNPAAPLSFGINSL